MGEERFTRGPWSIFDQHDATRINIRGPHEEFVADCADGFYSDETDEWVMADESLPNAHLIAAAPELFEALSFLIAGLPEKPNAVGMFSLGAVSESVVRDARAALSRARNHQGREEG